MNSGFDSAYYQPVVFDNNTFFGSNAPGFSFFAAAPTQYAFDDAPFDYHYQPYAAWDQNAETMTPYGAASYGAASYGATPYEGAPYGASPYEGAPDGASPYGGTPSAAPYEAASYGSVGQQNINDLLASTSQSANTHTSYATDGSLIDTPGPTCISGSFLAHGGSAPSYEPAGHQQYASGYHLHDSPRLDSSTLSHLASTASDEVTVRGATKDAGLGDREAVRQHLLSSVERAMSEEREFFNLRRPLYVQRIKQAMFVQPLKSVVIPLTATMPMWPISSVERNAILALRSADHKTLLESPLMVEVITSLMNKVLVLLCLQWGSALISSQIKRQMTHDLASLVSTCKSKELDQFIHKFVLVRCRYFRDVVVRQSKRDDSSSESDSASQVQLYGEPTAAFHYSVPVS